MRTRFRALLLTLFLSAFLAVPSAYSLVINSYVTITADVTYMEDVIIVAGGHLNIDNSSTVTIAAGFAMIVDMGILEVMPMSAIHIEEGLFHELPGSTIMFHDNAELRILMNGDVILSGGVWDNMNSIFTGTAPGGVSNLIIEDGNVLNGYATISGFDVQILDTWNITAASGFYFQTYGSFSDPSGSGAQSINCDGVFALSNGDFNFNTNAAYRINEIHVTSNGAFKTDNVFVYALPDITGDMNSNVATDNAEWYFEEGEGIHTEGFLAFYNSIFSAYTPAMGWYGMEVTGGGALSMSFCTVENVNTMINPYTIALLNNMDVVHNINNCTIHNPTTPNVGYGIYVLAGVGYQIHLLIECTIVIRFEIGIYIGFNGFLHLGTSQLYSNNIGCQFMESIGSEVIESAIYDNFDTGLMYDGALGNIIEHSEIYNNANVEIFAINGSEVMGNNNNIFNTVGGTYLIVVRRYSIVVIEFTWWGVYPPIIGVHFYVEIGCTMVFSNWVYIRYTITVYITCWIVVPKDAPETELPQLATSPALDVSNYPNPFNPSTQISYTLPDDMEVTLSVYSLTGQHVATLVDGFQTQGTHTAAFDAASDLPSGTYIYTLHTPQGMKSGKMILAK